MNKQIAKQVLLRQRHLYTGASGKRGGIAMSLYAVQNDKGEWLTFEPSLETPWYTNYPTLFKDKTYAESQAYMRGGNVVTLYESPHPVEVSEAEAEMLEQATCDDDPAELIVGFVNSHDKYDDDSKAEDRLMHAYVNGWTVEKPKRWNVKVAHSTDGYYWRGISGQVHTYTEPDQHARVLKTDAYTWTQKQIDDAGLQGCEKVEVTDDEQ